MKEIILQLSDEEFEKYTEYSNHFNTALGETLTPEQRFISTMHFYIQETHTALQMLKNPIGIVGGKQWKNC